MPSKWPGSSFPAATSLAACPCRPNPADLALSPDGAKLIVTCAGPKSTIAVLDAGSGETLATIPAGHTAGATTLSPDGTRLYVCNRFEHNVSVIDLPAAREITRVAAVREPVAAAVTPDGRTVLVANHLPNRRTDSAFTGDVAAVVTIIDAQTLCHDAIELPDGSNGLRGLCTTPDGSYALVTHLLSNFRMVPFRVDTGWINVNVVSIIDVPQRKLVGTIGLDEFYLGAGNPWDVACTADGKWVCVSSGRHARIERHRPRGPAEQGRTEDDVADDGRLADLSRAWGPASGGGPSCRATARAA